MICKQEAETHKALCRLARMPLDYQTIQTICDAVSSGFNVDVKITTVDGSVIEIKRGSNQQEMVYKSFAEKYNELHK